MVMGLTFQAGRRLAAHCVLLIGYAAILELGQLFAPGRHASFQDFAFSSAGVVIGGLFLWLARSVISSRLRFD